MTLATASSPDRQTYPIGAMTGFALSALTFVTCAIVVHHRTGILALNSDDSYIYLGYVKMAFTPGAGLFSYNVGEHSAGTTGILFYYLLAATYRALTLFVPKSPFSLVLNTWIVSGVCFSISGAILGRAIAGICRGLNAPGLFILPVILLLIGLTCASDNYLWGQMGGMENPLSALFVVALSATALARRPNMLLASALAAGLVGTRPDWGPVAALVPICSLLRRAVPIAVRLRDLVFGVILFSLLLTIIVIPLRLTTGQWQPSALGVRVELHWIDSFPGMWNAIVYTFNNGWGQSLAASWMAAVIYHYKTRTRPGIYLIPLFITLFLLLRAATGLYAFSVNDRYVSYLWPAMALTYVLAVVAMVKPYLTGVTTGSTAPSPPYSGERAGVRGDSGGCAADENVPSPPWNELEVDGCKLEVKRQHLVSPLPTSNHQLPTTPGMRVRLYLAALLGVSLALFAFGTIPAVQMISADTNEMLQVHVRPSQWLAAHLPANAIVAMEPAGALRTYTDFTLVDRTGLTTPHYGRYLRETGRRPEDDFRKFLKSNRVAWLYDYPRPAVFADNPRTLVIEKTWTPTPTIHSLGQIALMRVEQ